MRSLRAAAATLATGALLGLLTLGSSAVAQTQAAASETPGVLVVESGEPTRPAAHAYLGAFRRALAARDGAPVAVYLEAPDLVRFGTAAQRRQFLDYVAARYRGTPIGAIVAVGDPAIELLLAWEATPWPGVPLVAATGSPGLANRIRGRTGVTGFEVVFEVGKTLDAAVALVPGTKRVAVVSGGPPYGRPVLEALAERPELKVIRIQDLPLAETRERLSRLPPDAVVVYNGINVDGTGRRFTPQEVLDDLAPASSRPIFATTDTYLGHGIVGGFLVDTEEIGVQAARLVGRVLAGEPPEAIPLSPFNVARPTFDGRQLDRWGLREDRLPPGSRVRFREPTLWTEHRGTVVASVLALLVQGALIAALVVQARHRRRDQQRLRELSGRLLNSQETERTRIARDLHDDLNQRLALLAIRLDGLGRGAAGAEVRQAALGLAEQVRGLSHDVHRIARDLHPAILDHVGLVAALRHFAAEVVARHPELDVDVSEHEWPAGVPATLELALFRVAQEALQNVVKHSGARTARVELRRSADDLSLTVADSGRGFDPESRRSGQLGLAGMAERLRRFGGRLGVDSSSGGGTVLVATVPIDAVELTRLEQGPAGSALERQPAGG